MRECLNTPAREVFYTYEEEGEISLARVLKHSGERGFLGESLSRECLNTPAREVFWGNLSRESV